MSYIFEALQKSQHTRSSASSSVAATDVLRLAEVQEASETESESSPSAADAMEQPDLEGYSRLGLLPNGEEGLNCAPFHSFSHFDERTVVFEGFHSLAVSPIPQSRLVGLAACDSLAAEAFRLLAVRLRHLRRDRPLRTLLVTSTIPQEGKTTIAANLASMLAPNSEERVLLLDGDLRRPSIAKMLGLGEVQGLCEALQGERSLSESIYKLEGAGFWLLPAGNTGGSEPELLKSSKLFAFLEQLRTWFDWIVIDSPPILPLADTSVWSRLVDGLLLVTREGVTDKHELQRGIEALGSQRLLGAIVNCSSHSTRHYRYYQPSSSSAASPVSA